MRTIRITGILRLAPDAAASYARMRAEKLPAGGINSAWRSEDGQRRLFLSRYVPSKNRLLDRGPFNDVRKYKGVWYKRVRGYPVSVPGTSKHNQGLAIDVALGKPVFVWLKANGKEHGWKRPLLSADPVHWEYHARLDKAKKCKPAKPRKHIVTASVLRGRTGPSLLHKIVDRKPRGSVVDVERWEKGGGREWGRTKAGIYYAREYLKRKT